jgi:hypothetical protein
MHALRHSDFDIHFQHSARAAPWQLMTNTLDWRRHHQITQRSETEGGAHL